MSFSAAQLKADIEAWSETDLATMTDQQIADTYNDPTLEEVDRGDVETWRIFDRLDKAEYLTAILDVADGLKNRTLLDHILGMGVVNVNSSRIESAIVEVFGGASSTVKNLTGHAAGAHPGDDLRKRKLSRLSKLGWPSPIGPADVARARSA